MEEVWVTIISHSPGVCFGFGLWLILCVYERSIKVFCNSRLEMKEMAIMTNDYWKPAT